MAVLGHHITAHLVFTGWLSSILRSCAKIATGDGCLLKCLSLKHEDLSSDSQLPHQKLNMLMRTWDREGGGYLELDGQSGKLYQQSLKTIRWSGTDEGSLSAPGPHVHLCRLSHVHACITHMKDHHCYWQIRLITLQDLQLLSGSVCKSEWGLG